MPYVERVDKNGKVIVADRYYTSRLNWQKKKAANGLRRLLGRLFSKTIYRTVRR